METLGVNNYVGITASSIIDVYYALSNLKMNNYLVRNEMNGGYIAVGTSRLTSLKVFKRAMTIVYADLGPGLANLLNPISAATLEQVPAIFVTGTESSKLVDNRIIQNIQSEKLVENICKSYLVIEPSDIENGTIIKKIYDTLIKGFSYPRGAIVFIFKNDSSSINASTYLKHFKRYEQLLSIFESNYGFDLKTEIKSKDPFTGLYNDDWKKKRDTFLETNQSKLVAPKDMFTLVKEKLHGCQHPIMLIGMGALDYIHELLDFCRNAEIPYILTLPMNGFGNVDDPYYAFRMGHTATYCGNHTIQKCDLLITWGTSLNRYVVVNLNDNFNHIPCIIDVNKNPEIYYTPFIHHYLVGDGLKILHTLNREGIIHSAKRPQWLEMIRGFKQKGFELNDYFYSKSDKEMLKHGDIYRSLQKHVDKHVENTDKHVFFVTDSGSCQPFTATFIHYKTPRYHFITDGKYGSIGNGLGEAIGIAINHPNDLFICICGDSGTLDGAVSDYLSLKELNIKNIIFVILENSGIGFISETSLEQSNKLLNYGNGYKHFPKWKPLFESLLIESHIVKNAKEMDESLTCAFSNVYKQCSVLVCVLPYEAYYSPTVPINGNFSQLIYHKFNDKNSINACRYASI